MPFKARPTLPTNGHSSSLLDLLVCRFAGVLAWTYAEAACTRLLARTDAGFTPIEVRDLVLGICLLLRCAIAPRPRPRVSMHIAAPPPTAAAGHCLHRARRRSCCSACAAAL